MEYVVIETGGKQYRVSEGQVVDIDNLNATGQISFDRVLLHVSDAGVAIGKPYLNGMAVKAKILKSAPGKKLRVGRFTAKSRHRRIIGFRPMISTVEIQNIVETASQAKPAKAKK